jgi:hypothetical protein
MRDRQRELQQEPTASMPSGQIVMGPGFYVWDENPREAREWGIELANAWLSRSAELHRGFIASS